MFIIKTQEGKRRLLEQIDNEQSDENKRRLEELGLKGSNGWIGAIPIRAQGRYLPKAEFQDSIRLRLGLVPSNMPTKCACGQMNSVNHAKNCHIGGYINMRHDAIRDYIRDKAALVYHDVEKETKLKPVEEQMLNPGAIITTKARSDVRVMRFTRPSRLSKYTLRYKSHKCPSR